MASLEVGWVGFVSVYNYTKLLYNFRVSNNWEYVSTAVAALEVCSGRIFDSVL